MVINTVVRMVYPFLPAFGRGLGVDLWLLSFAVTLRSSAGVVGPFLASVADSRGRKAGMLFGVGLFTLGVGLITVWPAYPAFVLALLLTILGNFVFIPSMQAYLGDRVAYQQRGRVLGLTELGWSLSFILGVPLAGFLIARAGWNAPFPILTGLGVLALAGLAWLLPKDPVPEHNRPSLWQNLSRVFRSAPALAGLLMGISFSAGNELVNLIFGVWMEASFGLQIAALGAASAVIGISELGGESLASGLTDWLGKPRAVAAGLVLNSLAALGLPLLGQSAAGAVTGLFLFYLTFEFTLVSSIPLMTEILPASRATLMATYVAGLSVGRAFGDLLAPPLFTWGMLAIAVGATLFNLVALLALNRLKQGIGDKG